MGFNLAGLGAAFKGQQEYDLYMQGKKMRDMQLAQMQQQNDPMVAQMAWDTQMGMQQPVPPMPGQASVPAAPPMPQGAPQLPPGGPQQGAPMPPQAAPPQAPPAPPIPPYKPLNKGPQQEDVSPPMAQKPMVQPMPQPQGQGAPMPEQADKPQAPAGPPVELRHNMSMQDAQKFIQQNYPNVSATQKFAALEKVHGYMSQDAKMEFQERVLDLKSKVAEAQIKLKEEKEASDEQHRKDQGRLMELEGILKKSQSIDKEAQAKARPIEASAKKETADARMMSAEASRSRAATAASTMAAGGSLDADDYKAMAKQYLAGDKSVFTNLGRGQQGVKNIAQLRHAIRVESEAMGMTPTDIATKLAEFEGLKAGERTLGTRTANIGMAGNAASNFAEQVLETSAKYKRFPWKTVNDIQIAMDDKTQSKELRAHAAAVNSYINAYARAVNPQGAATVSDKEHAREILEKGFSNGDTKAAIGQLQKEIAAEKKAPGQTKKELADLASGNTSGANKQVFSSKAELEAAIKAKKINKGDTFYDPSGVAHVVN